MSDQNVLKLASVSDMKVLVVARSVSFEDALARCDVVLSRQQLSPSKRTRWTKLRQWIVNEQKAAG